MCSMGHKHPSGTQMQGPPTAGDPQTVVNLEAQVFNLILPQLSPNHQKSPEIQTAELVRLKK